MAVTVIATAGASNANSYCTLAEADAYHDRNPHALEWSSATAAEKNAALVRACELLETYVVWMDGSVASVNQALYWPRDGVPGKISGWLSNAAIPEFLKHMNAELARLQLIGDRTRQTKGSKFRTSDTGVVEETAEQVVPSHILAIGAPYGAVYAFNEVKLVR